MARRLGPDPGPASLSLELGQVQWGAPCWAVWHLANPSPRLPCPPAALQAGCGFGLLGGGDGREGGPDVEGAENRSQVHKVSEFSPRWLPGCLWLAHCAGAPGPNACPARMEHILSRGPLSSWGKPYEKRPAQAKAQFRKVSSGNPWSHRICWFPSSVPLPQS